MLLCAFMHECVFCARVFTCVYVCFSDENRQNEGETGRFLLELSGFSESLWQLPPPSNPYFCLLGFFVLPRTFDFLPIPLLFFFLLFAGVPLPFIAPFSYHQIVSLSSFSIPGHICFLTSISNFILCSSNMYQRSL